MTSNDASPDVESHLRIINPVPQSTRTFPLFAQFPADIRGLIWEQALSHERILNVSLGTTAIETKNTTHQGYGICLNERLAISKLFRVTSESRHVALAFYRVQLPCWYVFPQGRSQMGILYVCPELDTIRLRSWEHLDKFAHDVWMADPRRIGLVNLCLSSDFWNDEFERPDVKGPHIRQAMSRLERVVIFEQFVGRACRSPHTRNFEMNRAIPILVSVPIFDRLASDPRLRDEDLWRVSTGRTDPRKDFHRWFKFLAELQIQYDHKVDYRFALCHGIGGELELLVDQEMVHWWLKKKEYHWRERVQELKDQGRGDRVDGELNLTPQPAVGFWLFQLKSLGPFPDIDETNEQEAFPKGRFLDMSQHKPELCLSNIY